MRTFIQKPNATQQTMSAKSTIPCPPHFEQGGEVNSILYLQRTIGNQAVQRLLEANTLSVEGDSTTTKIARFGHDFSRIPAYAKAPMKTQTKLTVNTPGDAYEQGADRIAEQVSAAPVIGGPPRIQRFSEQSNGRMDTAPASVDRALASPGRPLETALRQDMEQRFGYDFSRVRVHSGAAAEQSAQEVDANAYTVGWDIVFGAGRFAPGTNQGQRLLAHELTHVVQQSGSDRIRNDQTDEKRGLSLGNRRVAGLLAAGNGIWRQPARTTTGTITNADRREFVRDATKHFTQAAKHYAAHALDATTFERVINAWYALLANREDLIKQLGGDAILTRDLHAAYTDAIRSLMKQAALLLNRPEADLYRENSGRIPVWAWLQPHFMEFLISTPIPVGRSATPLTGEVKFSVNGFDVTIKQDGLDPGITGAQTRLDLIPGSISRRLDASGVVSSFTVPTPAATIQTFFGPGATTKSTSAVGRGTTKEDVAGGRVTPHSTSLGFHEGHHGLDFVEFLETNPPPAFTGAVGQTNAQFNAAITLWNAAWATFNADADRFSKRRTD